MKALVNVRVLALVLIIAAAVATRFLKLPVNVSAIGAMALFAGLTFKNRVVAFGLPILALLISDAILGFHELMWAVYGAFALVVAIGIFVRDASGIAPKALGSILGSVLFFVITNFAVWAQMEMYPKTQDGLVACFIAALPFLKNQVVGDLAFFAVLLGTWSVVEKSVPAVSEANA